ncbi:MAG: S9 family peptidase [Candidatus Aminicenantes bacterium]|nr:S9 family peptidase [Candidatus Aminicenantes bacterium]
MKKHLASVRVVVLLIGVVFIGFSLAAEKPFKLLETETYFEMESVGAPQISPDGQFIIFTRGWVDKINDQSRSNVWIADIDGKRIRELTHGNWRDSSPVWSPDGKKIAFLSERDQTTQIHVMWLDTGDVAQLTHIERAPGGLVWSPDGKWLAYTAFVPDEKPILNVKLPKRPEGAKWAAPAVLVDRLAWRSDGRGPLPRGYTHIYVIDAELGGTPRPITSGDYNHNDPHWSADGKTIFFSAIRKPDAEYTWGDSEIYAVDLKTLEVKALTDRKGPDGSPRVSPDGKWIAYSGFEDKNYTSHLSSVSVMDSNGGSKKLLAGNLPSSPGNIIWAADNSGLYYQMEERGENNLYFVSLAGAVKKVTKGAHVLSGVSIAKNGQAAATISTPYRPGYLVTFNLLKPEAAKELVDVNADVLAEVKLGEIEELKFYAPDGLGLQGWLIKPAEFDPAKKYPMLLYIHGGPWSMYSVAFNWDWQNFAANGYAVLFMNPRGSTGYGQDFVNGIQFSYPGKDYDDLMAGVDAALTKGFIDKDNLFVCGGSGGGILTAWIVGHTNRFRAAVSMRPVINWHSFVGITDGPSWYRQFRKYPWEDPLEYALRSPLNYVANVTTPTMVMTGEADLRTPIAQSEEFYRALKLLKKETLLVRMPEEYHGWRRPSHRLLQQAYLMAWFEKYRVKK